jgi:uncharacterized protein YqhQ
MSEKENGETKGGGIMKLLKRLVLLALVAGLAYQFTQLEESKKRFIIHLAKQAPYLPGRYYA